MEGHVRREIFFNDIEKIERFIMMYNDLFQTTNSNKQLVKRFSSSFEGYEYYIVFHMNKDSFESLRKNKIIKIKKNVPYKNSLHKRNIWVLC